MIFSIESKKNFLHTSFQIDPAAETSLLFKVMMNPKDKSEFRPADTKYYFGGETTEHFFFTHERSITSQVKLGNRQNHLGLAGTRVLLSKSPYDDSWMSEKGEASLMLQFEDHFIEQALNSLSLQTPLLPILPNQQRNENKARGLGSTRNQGVSHILGKSIFDGTREKVELTELAK
ncbi:hypothetical protein OAG71_04205 [bacterium]|nr:hypothetical protein [bacterium]